MARDVIITPASGLIDFKDDLGNLDAKIQIDTTGNLSITNSGGDLSLGDNSATLFIGDGVTSADIVFEQGGTIYASNTKTLTLGSTGSTTSVTGQLQIPIATGTAPLAVNSTTVVTNLNADYLDGNHGTFYTNASNLSSGTVAVARLGSGSPSATTFLRGDGAWVTALGASGATGTAGTNGATGVTGASGATGTAGTNGTNGATGIQGASGATGTAGSNGTNGATGTAGTNGATGIQGIQGASGATGTAGTNGATGIQGIQGASGATGTAGTNGATGTAGSNGTNGATGIQGASGSTGPTGAQGASGATGTAGTNGTNGATGTAGTNGATGPVGATGAGSSLTVTDDTSTNSSFYPIFEDATSGTFDTVKVSSTKLYFNPSTGTLNATVFNSLSDIKYKDNITIIPDSLQIIDKLDGVSFTWKETGSKSYGVIAQDIEKILPELVDGDDIKSVNYSGIIAILINAIKEQQKQINELKQKIFNT